MRSQRITRARLSLDWVSGTILAAMAVIVILLWLVAWVAPPNNTDSLQYHMSRVVHWAQDASLNHYPTAFDPQLINPIFAETAILNFRLLFGSDKPANLVQWLSMLGCLGGVSAIAALLGASRRGQLLASAFALSIPMGLLQSSSTQNDYVVAFWLVCLAYYGVIAGRRSLTLSECWQAGAALGLGLLTKGTYYPYALPFVLWIATRQIAHAGSGRAFARLVGIGAVVVLLNAGYWARNVGTYGAPLGPAGWIQSRTSSNRWPTTVVAALAENTLLNFATPFASVNSRISSMAEAFSARLGLPPHGFALTWSWNHEDLAGSPVQLLMVPIAFLALLFGGHDQRPRRLALAYGLVSLATLVLLSAVVTFDVYGLRYQLPFLVIWAPMVGVAFARNGYRRLAVAATIALLIISLPWVLLNRSRPLVGKRPTTMTQSILNILPVDILFAKDAAEGATYEQAVRHVEGLGCTNVGLRIDSHDREYAFWWLLHAPQSGVRIEVVDPTPATARYLDPAFKPCAIVCTICGQRTSLHGLPLTGTFGSVTVFSGSGYTPNKDG